MWRNGKWVLSHNTATHQDNFKHKKRTEMSTGMGFKLTSEKDWYQTQLLGWQKLIAQMLNNAEEAVLRNHPRCLEEDFNASQLLTIVESK